MDDSLDPDDHRASLLPAGDHPPPGSFSVKKRNKLLPHEAAVICFFLLSQLTLTLTLHVHSHQSGPREGRTLSEMRGEGENDFFYHMFFVKRDPRKPCSPDCILPSEEAPHVINPRGVTKRKIKYLKQPVRAKDNLVAV